MELYNCIKLDENIRNVHIAPNGPAHIYIYIYISISIYIHIYIYSCIIICQHMQLYMIDTSERSGPRERSEAERA